MKLPNMANDLLLLDFDGTLADSFVVIEKTLQHFDYQIGTLENFKNRRKFLKYVGGRKEFIPNVIRKLRQRDDNLKEVLTEIYRAEATLFPGIKDFLLRIQQRSNVAISIISRNVTLEPYITIQTVLKNSGIVLRDIDSIHTVPVGDKKARAMKYAVESYSMEPDRVLSVGDEVGDYKCARKCGIKHLACAYGYDSKRRLCKNGVSEKQIVMQSEDLESAIIAEL